MFYIYELYIENSVEPFYVGYSKNPSERLYRHIRDASGVEKHLRKAKKILKAISENKQIISKTVYETEIFENVLLKEKELIAHYGRLDLGTGILYNMTDGGDGHINYQWSQEARDRKSKLMLGDQRNKGRKRPDTSERESLPIFVYLMDGTFFNEYPAQCKAAEILGVNKQSISKCLKGICQCAIGNGIIYQFSKIKVDKMAAIEKTQLAPKPKLSKVYSTSIEHRKKLSESNRLAKQRGRKISDDKDIIIKMKESGAKLKDIHQQTGWSISSICKILASRSL